MARYTHDLRYFLKLWLYPRMVRISRKKSPKSTIWYLNYNLDNKINNNKYNIYNIIDSQSVLLFIYYSEVK